jgi:hypothetical protein
MLTRLTSVSMLAASLALVGCFGDDDDAAVTPPPPAPPPAPAPATAVPDSALASTTSFVSYLNGQSFTDETSEALTLPAGDPPTSETEEPQTI